METDCDSALQVTMESLPKILADDFSVKMSGIDVDGVLRGKLVDVKKFQGIAQDGFGFCSVIFGWDMHDRAYNPELKISNKENGYRDLIAVPDLQTFRRIPWEDNIPLVLCSFYDPDTRKPISVCPRSLLKTAVDMLRIQGLDAMAGAEYEFYHFRFPKAEADGSQTHKTSVSDFLRHHSVEDMPHLTDGMFGYSITRPSVNKDYYYDVFKSCREFRCNMESWHTETGPGVFEAALAFGPIDEMADRASLFKLLVKSVAQKHDITPCFMAKPREGLPGCSGHMHISIVDAKSKENLFARKTKDENAKWTDLQYVSDMGRYFLAGLLDGLPDIMPMLAPNINSYKRLVENFWAPVTVSWGLEHRAASIRIIAPPTASVKATRFEVRVPGADANPHYVLAAILALGQRGIDKKLEIKLPPLAKGEDVGGASDQGLRLAQDLRSANERFMRQGSVAREVFGDEFVEHFGGTRAHEIRLWEQAVVDWEIKRYIEVV